MTGQPHVLVDGFLERAEHEWPLARTRWVRHHLDADDLTLRPEPSLEEASRTYEAHGEGLTFTMPPVGEDTEITGPPSARLFLSSATADADVFVTLRAFSPDGDELLLQGAIDPKTPIAQGWLRASHRARDEDLSTSERPYHPHDGVQPLQPGEAVRLDIELWPTSLLLPAGWHLALTIAGADFDHGQGGARLDHFANELRGCGPFIHADRPADLFGGATTIHTGGSRTSSLLLPVVPPAGDSA